MSALSFLLAFAAGVLTVLSPCVLPLVPVLLSGAASRHAWAPMALAAGVGLSFAAAGGGLAVLGMSAGSIGGGGDLLKIFAALVVVLLGLVLMVPALQTRFALLAEPFSNRINARFGSFAGEGLTGQFALGLLLGAIWTPCVGPTLGAASLLASRGQNLGAVTLTMLMFGLGTGLTLALLGLVSRQALVAWRGNMIGTGQVLKAALGGGLLLIGLSILTGWDKTLEGMLVDASPLWLTQLTTQF